MLESRYRVIGLLGRGGMGEVYRADDLRLGQAVALKFLPESLARDAVRLAQFHNEVRTARQVSHANVCRVYDIGEIDGQIYLSMEYVDGEDLSSLLRRIGRLPEDKAIEIARQLCAGLAAAHERGVVHRDLKPANVMLDGTGKVRVMDFSLASVGEVQDIRAGTPAYMAPEQLAGRDVTTRSDIYALGLVLYELFTGRRAFEAKTLADLVEQHQSGAITAPTELVKTLDETIERAIMRCLDPEPARRPASPLSVSAALPGGDPLAAALAAGETPSPEMVAAAGGESATLSLRAGVIWFAAAALLVAVLPNVSDRASILARLPPPKPMAVLIDRAHEVLRTFGYTDAVVDEASELIYDDDFFSWMEKEAREIHWSDLASGQPAPLRFWLRTSPTLMVPLHELSSPSLTDPPFTTEGMTKIKLDLAGRLLFFEANPPEIETTPAGPVAAVDWRQAFAAAGLDLSRFTDATPSRTPRLFADERHAWRGSMPGRATPLQIEAASYRGKLVSFQLVFPWTENSRAGAGAGGNSKLSVVLILSLLVAAVVVARRNLRSGRADRRGAFQLATFIFVVIETQWLLAPHVMNLQSEEQRTFMYIAIGLFLAAVLYLIYLAIEPFVRRSWPTMLVGWSRLLTGRVRDAVIGRDVVIGTVAGLGLGALQLFNAALPGMLGWREPSLHIPFSAALEDGRTLVLLLVGCVNGGLQTGLLSVLTFAFLRQGVGWAMRRVHWRRPSADLVTAQVLTILFVAGEALNGFGSSAVFLAMAYQLVSVAVTLTVMLRVGLLPVVIMYFVSITLSRVPLTLDGGRSYAVYGWLVLAAMLASVAAGVWLARANELKNPRNI